MAACLLVQLELVDMTTHTRTRKSAPTHSAARRDPGTIRVSQAAAMIPLGPRRFRQLVGLETEEGRAALELEYADRYAVINRTKALEWVDVLRTQRCTGGSPRLANLGVFAGRCAVDPNTRQRICVEPGCPDSAEGRSKLCHAHRIARLAQEQGDA